MAYDIHDNIISSEIVEVNVADQCNLSCRGCSHLSPISRKKYYDPVQLSEELGALATVYHAKKLRLLGGEPLLHPNLVDVVSACRRSGISDKICVVTNGVLLDRISDELLDAIDILEISDYGGINLTESRASDLAQRVNDHNCVLRVLRFSHFRESYSETGTKDRGLIKDIYDTCLIAHKWACHNVENGYFYKCPQAHVLRNNMPKLKDTAARPSGVQILSNQNLFSDLRRYLMSPAPLLECKYCLGSVGKLYPHEQKKRVGWREFQTAPTEDLLDSEFLGVLKNVDADANNSCVTETLVYEGRSKS